MFYHNQSQRLGPSRKLILNLAVSLLLAAILISLCASAAPGQQQEVEPNKQNNGTFFDKLRNSLRGVPSTSSQAPPITTTLSPVDQKKEEELAQADSAAADEEEDDDEEDEEEDEDEDEQDEEEDKEIAEVARALTTTKPEVGPKVYDLLGNQLKLEGNRTVIVLQNKARDLGLLTIKAILLGPLIGLTLKAALFRGLLWAVGAYFMHLFFPSLLSTLGLGTGLVGFARNGQAPDYSQLLLRAALNYLETRR